MGAASFVMKGKDMPRYIDLDKAKKLLDDCPNKGFIKVDDLPIADVIEVVRCKDCRWYKEEKVDRGFKPSFCVLFSRWQNSNFYCADGERR